MSENAMTPPLGTGWRILRGLPIAGAALGLVFAYVGLRTTQMTLATNPCAGALDNPFALAAFVSFLAGIAGSLVIAASSAVRRERDGVIFGVVALIVDLVVEVLGMALAGAGYGWHCPLSAG